MQRFSEVGDSFRNSNADGLDDEVLPLSALPSNPPPEAPACVVWCLSNSDDEIVVDLNERFRKTLASSLPLTHRSHEADV